MKLLYKALRGIVSFTVRPVTRGPGNLLNGGLAVETQSRGSFGGMPGGARPGFIPVSFPR